ncbi:MAG TPA: DUF6337 family protein [Bacteroidales bacterium]|nr:DUF6337 family protein [Bacteroidales bacterium]HPS16379.1 DUF6337 family protein [Bacteroidales bacterium]
MLNLVLYLILFAEIVLITNFDRKIFANYFSPVTILSYPLLIIVTITLAFGGILGYKPVNSSLLLLFIAGILVFWSGSFLWGKIIPIKIIEKITNKVSYESVGISKKIKRILLIAAWFVIAYLIYSFISTFLKYDDTDAIGTNEFIYEYAGSGIAGHLMGISILFLIIFIGIAKRKDYLIFITILFFIILSLLYQVKTWLYIPVIGGLLFRWFDKKKIKIKVLHIVIFVITVLLLFGLTYVFAMQDRKDATFFFKIYLLAKHFMGYVFAGILGFGEHMNKQLPVGQNPKALIMPFMNLYHFISGGSLEGVISPYHVFIDKKELVDVNVKTFFGTILINGGYVIGIIYTFILSIILYFIFFIASISKNFWIIVLYAFSASALALGWFDFYYNQLPFIELSAYLLILIFVLKIKTKK